MTGLRETQQALRAAVDAFDQVSGGPSGDAEHEAAVALRYMAEAAVIALAGSLSDEDTCTVGDRDPTPWLLDEGNLCGADDPDYPGGVACTRYVEHAGRQHVAGNGDRVVHVWPSRSTDRVGGDQS